MTDRPLRNDFASASLALAVVALVAIKLSPAVAVGISVAAMVLALLGIRTGVRLDFGMPRALFGLAFGLFALAVATIRLGGDHGGQFSGLGPALSLIHLA